MIVFIAGATGAIGRPLVQQLVAGGHEVIGTTRSTEKLGGLRSAGAAGIIVDARDTEALRRAIISASPHVVIDQLSDLSQPLRAGGFEDWLQTTIALRRDVTPALVDAAREAGAVRVIAQSAAFMTAPTGPDIVDESAPLYLDAPKPLTGTITSNAAVEAVVTRAQGIDGIILRYGFLYGPGTAYAPDGDFIEQIRAGAYPIVGTGEGRFPFIHVHDAAAATVLALDRGSTGIYNVVDDNPAQMREWVPYVARLVGAPPPARVSVQRAEQEVGRQLVYYGTQLRGAANRKARRDLGFSPVYRDWRDGFRASLAPETSPGARMGHGDRPRQAAARRSSAEGPPSEGLPHPQGSISHPHNAADSPGYGSPAAGRIHRTPDRGDTWERLSAPAGAIVTPATVDGGG